MSGEIGSVVIPTRERHRLLAQTVRSVLSGRRRPTEIVIIDQSAARASEIEALAVSGTRIRYVWSAGRGASRARNDGIGHARHPLIAIIDDDVELDPDWLDALLSALMSRGPRAVVTGRVLPGPTPTGEDYVPSVNVSGLPASYRGRLGKDVLFSNNFAMRREVVDEVGWFDERLGPGARWSNAEDNDFGFRLLEAGYTIHYVPEAVLTHLAWRTPRQLLRLRWSYGRGQGGFYAKHWSARDPHLTRRLLRDLGASVGAAARFGVRLDPWAATHVAHAAGLVSGFLQWRAIRPPAPPSLQGGPEHSGDRDV